MVLVFIKKFQTGLIICQKVKLPIGFWEIMIIGGKGDQTNQAINNMLLFKCLGCDQDLVKEILMDST